MKNTKTNVMRLLDEANISYTPYEYDETIVDGEGVAQALNEDPECVFKSLVCENDKHEHFIFEVPVNGNLNLKKAAKVSHSKSIETIVASNGVCTWRLFPDWTKEIDACFYR